MDIAASPENHKLKTLQFSESGNFNLIIFRNNNTCMELMGFPFFKLSVKMDRETPTHPNPQGERAMGGSTAGENIRIEGGSGGNAVKAGRD